MQEDFKMVGGRFEKGRTPWNKGLTKLDHPSIMEASLRLKKYNATRNQSGSQNPAWSGGKPKCDVCKKELSHYNSKRCKACNNKRK